MRERGRVGKGIREYKEGEWREGGCNEGGGKGGERESQPIYLPIITYRFGSAVMKESNKMEDELIGSYGTPQDREKMVRA